MDHSSDELRRDRRELARAQQEAMGSLRRVTASAFEHASATTDGKADAVLGGIARRRFLTVGGFSVATAAVLAACGRIKKGPVPQTGRPPATTPLPEQNVDDVVLLRTASSLDHTLVGIYTALFGMNVLTGPAADTAKLFSDQHQEHASFFEKLTSAAGGTPFTESNPVVQKNIVDPSMALIMKSSTQDRDALAFLQAFEQLAASTYQSFVPTFSTPPLRRDVMTVGGVESRHAAALAKLLPGASAVPPAASIATTTTSAAAGASTTSGSGAAQPTSVYQVPGAFGPLTSQTIVLDNSDVTIDVLSTNSFMYSTS
jgi:hypothetical protein